MGIGREKMTYEPLEPPEDYYSYDEEKATYFYMDFIVKTEGELQWDLITLYNKLYNDFVPEEEKGVAVTEFIKKHPDFIIDWEKYGVYGVKIEPEPERISGWDRFKIWLGLTSWRKTK